MQIYFDSEYGLWCNCTPEEALYLIQNPSKLFELFDLSSVPEYYRSFFYRQYYTTLVRRIAEVAVKAFRKKEDVDSYVS